MVVGTLVLVLDQEHSSVFKHESIHHTNITGVIEHGGPVSKNSGPTEISNNSNRNS